MVSVAFQLIEEVTAHAQSDSLEDAREICADGTYFLNNLRIWLKHIYERVSRSRVFPVHRCPAVWRGSWFKPQPV